MPATGKRDECDRPVYEDEYGEYSRMTPASLETYQQLDARVSNCFKKINAEWTALEARRTSLSRNIIRAVVRAERRADGILGDGRDYNHIAPKSRDERRAVEKREHTLMARYDRLQTIRFRLTMNYMCEMAYLEGK